ncbi:MAG TPA: hypothetical protein ENH23_05350, partial [candidate division Zixibacteria bacterium]|nr:hypothetical protein [candidate division Zixibacteria bacterium]
IGNYYINPLELPGIGEILKGHQLTEENQQYIMLPEVTAVFPSITLASWASIFTGSMPGPAEPVLNDQGEVIVPAGTGILGNEFFDRSTEEMITFSDGAFPMMSILDRYPLGNSYNFAGIGAADKALSWNVETVYEAIRYINPDLKSTTVMHNYSRGADEWLYQETLIDKLRLAWNAKFQHDNADIARLMDSSPTNDSVEYIQRLTDAGEKFPILFAVYFAGLDHWAHDFGMDSYIQFFKDNSDEGIRKIVNELKNGGEFDNKIFIITADHGHTGMPHNYTVDITDPETGQTKSVIPDTSCKLKLKHFDRKDIQEPELANNNLHIWELGEVLNLTGFLKGTEGLDFAVLAPKEIASLYEQYPYGAKPDAESANVIAAFNGPMSHVYVKNRANNSWNSPRLVDDIGYVAELIRLTLSNDKSPSNMSDLFPAGLFEKAIPISAGIKRLINSVDIILIRRGNNYEVYQGIKSDGSDVISIPLNNYTEISSSRYVKAIKRIEGLNHPERSGDIILIFKDFTDDVPENRFSSGSACKSWHGSLNPSDSYVPLILAYPGGNKVEIEEIMKNVSACPNGHCDGNWNVTDIIKEIITRQYE